MNARADQVKQRIEAAFSGVPYPGDDHITYAPDAWECAELTADFRGRRWKDVPVEVLRAHAAHLSLFSAAALPYYLPAYLLAAFDDLDVRDFLLSELDTPASRFEPLTAAQKNAIKAFLQWMRDEAQGDISRTHWSNALERYWDRDWR
ncbi:MAG TPA: DUF6714 family protein [Myxococcus sp.]|jgi:hypothetical protein|nr:DUF6714 family protein [Myxococcus sp.]